MDNKRKLPYRKASFMKVFEDDATKKLPIPPAFSKIFEGDIPPWIILEIAETRKCWRVDIEKDGNGGMYLGCGFDCFVKAESLEVGNFLLFTLEEPSILQVKIYEKDGSEKTEGTTIESEYKVGTSESPMTPRQTPNIHRETEASPWPTLPSDQYGSYGTYEKPQRDIGGNKRKKGILSATEQGMCFSMTWKQVGHFVYYMTIPKAMLTGKTISNKEILILKDQEGNSWPVELRMRRDGRVDLARGWRDFVAASALVTGDTLTFVFVADKVIQVHVERTSRVDNSSEMEQVCKIEPAEYLNMACDIEEHAANCNILNNAPVTMPEFGGVASGFVCSSFSVTYTVKSRFSHLHIPKAIAIRQKLEHRDTVVLCDPEGRQWLLEVRTKQSDGRVELFRGWADFVKSYEIGIGDTLMFEFVNDHMMKVKIMKASGLNHVNVTGGMFTQEIMQLL